MPWTSKVGIIQIRFMTSSASLTRSERKRWSLLKSLTVKPHFFRSSSSFFVGGTTSV